VGTSEPATQVVNERAGSRNFLWGFLTVVFGAALVRGHIGAETSSGRIVVDVFMGLLFVGSLAGWIWFNRHPARLRITPGSIELMHKGQQKGLRLANTGHLYISRTFIGGKNPIAYFRVAGSDDAIPCGNFNVAEVQQATTAAGWRWGEPPA
jgi:hypothetical protein